MNRQRSLRTAFALSLILAFAQQARADLHRRWEYSELSAKAGLVVIAEPISKDRLLGPIDGSWDLKPVATEFRVIAVVRGMTDGKAPAEGAAFTLNHQGNPNHSDRVGGRVMTFEPNPEGDAATHKAYLMFLAPTEDGAFTPVAGGSETSQCVRLLSLHIPNLRPDSDHKPD